MRACTTAIALTALFLTNAAANADVLEIEYTNIRESRSFPTIVVEGSGDRYRTVKTRKLTHDIPLRICPPENLVDLKHGFVWIEGRNPSAFYVKARATHNFVDYGWRLRRVSFPVQELRAWSDPHLRLTPVRLCNDEIKRRSGAQRAQFLKNGRKMFRHSLYQVHATAVWRMKGQCRQS